MIMFDHSVACHCTRVTHNVHLRGTDPVKARLRSGSKVESQEVVLHKTGWYGCAFLYIIFPPFVIHVYDIQYLKGCDKGYSQH
jgi:hypothetical protein